MKTSNPSRTGRIASLPVIGTIVILTVFGIFVWLPHRTQVIEAHSTLQNGLKMDARFTLKSPWGWTTPSRIAAMSVSINGKDVAVADQAYRGLQPFSPKVPPAIAEKGGFPVVILRGLPNDLLSEADWYFLNYSFSQLRVIKNHREEVSYYSDPNPVIAMSSAVPIAGSAQPIVTPPLSDSKSQSSK